MQSKLEEGKTAEEAVAVVVEVTKPAEEPKVVTAAVVE
jgi:hypothetical protein